ncbi:helix-turn-helix domain-containing protein [Rhodopseudomonas telluris]|uniref:Helix-turn-helix domain-containing protein n=1 Tax=Rhodopseudomonas telluris TaxID=644215 RepID=A0ABV6EYZ5_9BRAD
MQSTAALSPPTSTAGNSAALPRGAEESPRSQVLQASSTDVDEHCASLGAWRLAYDQISAGAFRGSFALLSLPRVEVFRENTSQQVRQYGQLGVDRFGIALPWQASGEVSFNGVSITPTRVIACFDAEVDMCTPEQFELRGVVTSAKLVEELADTLRIALPQDAWHQLRAIEMETAALQRLRQLLTDVYDTLAASPDAFDEPSLFQAIEDAVLVEITDMLPTARPCDEVRSAAARKRTVDRACELMLATGDEAVSILDVCRHVGVSRRKLNYCFQHVLGTTPIAYARAVRLNRVRRDLKHCRDPHTGVYDVAASHGFWHFSQFSLDYKRHFCELPSETLRRGRAA